MWDTGKQVINRDLLVSIVKLSVITGISFITFTWLLKQLDPTGNKQKQVAKEKAAKLLKKIGKNKLNLTEYEMLMASHLVLPSDIEVDWNRIAGLDNVIDEISETVIFPIRESSVLKESRLARPPKGVLLYGPPGCGKTLIAKATAKEAITSFINLDISMLTDKWYGESQKLVAALFSLAEKIQPCIIFIDEIDSLLRARSSQDHEATAMMKAQFMFLWDGLITDADKTVIVMGATNRPQDLDAAIRRRMPATFYIPMPSDSQRQDILQLVLKSEKTDNIDYHVIVNETEGFSGSDLHELCRQAALYCVRDCAQSHSSSRGEGVSIELRPINMADMKKAIGTMKRARLVTDRQLLE